MRLYVIAAFCDEEIALYHFLRSCVESKVSFDDIFICVDNARPEVLKDTAYILDECGINWIETRHRPEYVHTSYYCSCHSAVELALSGSVREEDLLYVTPIDLIPNPGFYEEILTVGKGLCERYRHKWCASAGYCWYPGRQQSFVYRVNNTPYNGTDRYHLTEGIEDIEGWLDSVPQPLHKGQSCSQYQTASGILPAPIIIPIKRWKELNGYKGDSFKTETNTSWDIKFFERNLKYGGSQHSLMGVSVFHHDQRKILWKERWGHNSGKNRWEKKNG